MTYRNRFRRAFWNYLAAPASARPLAVLRMAVCGVLLLQGFWISDSLLELYGRDGLYQETLSAFLIDPLKPRVADLQRALDFLGLDHLQWIKGLFTIYMGALALLFIGWWSRSAAVVAWLTHYVLIMNNGHISSYGADSYAHYVLFYFLFMPVSAVWSVDAGNKEASPNSWNRLSLRVLQIHLCYTYLVAGLAKAEGFQWWNGEAVWRAMMLPEFSQWNVEPLAPYAVFFLLAAWGTLLIEIGYPLFMGIARTRRLWVAATVALHLGIFFGLGLYSFSLLMMGLTVSLFAVCPEPRGATSRS